MLLGHWGELTSCQVNQHAPLQFSYNAVGQRYLRRSRAGFINSSHYTATGLHWLISRAGRGPNSFTISTSPSPTTAILYGCAPQLSRL